MEAPFEGFSIREYAARMRRVDASKCWPFDGDGQLPPIECRRYRWWSSELQIARSDCECEQRAGAAEHACGADATVVRGAEGVGGCKASLLGEGRKPAVRQGVLVIPAWASGFNGDEDGDEEGRRARSPGKAKLRTPKKRSIVELFAVAPQIEAAEDDGDGKVLASDKAKAPEEQPEDEAHGKDLEEELRKPRDESVETLTKKKIKKNCTRKNKENEEKKKKKKRRRKKKKTTKTKMTLNQQQQMLLRKKQQKNSVKMGIAKKEKIRMLNLQSPVDFARLLCDSVIVKRFGKEIKIPAYAQKKKPAKSKNVPKQNKVKAVQTSKMKKQLHEPRCFPIHSILKNQKTVTHDLGEVHTTDNSQNGEGHRPQQLEKHVRFSGKDDILGHGGSHCSPLGSPQMQSLCKVFSDVLAASSVVDKLSEDGTLSESNNKSQILSANEDTAPGCLDNGKTGGHLLLSTNIHDLNNAATSSNPQSNHAKENTSLDDCVDLNSTVEVHCDLNQIDPCPMDPLFKVTHSSHREGCDHQVLNETGKKTGRVDAGGNGPSGSASVDVVANMVRNSNSELATSPLSVDTATNRGPLYPVGKHHEDIYTSDSQFHSSCLLKRDMMSTIYSTGSVRQLYHMDDLPESRLKANPVDMLHDKHTHGEVIGLPLSSQGEYIHLQESTQFGFEQLPKKQNNVQGSVGSFLADNSIDLSCVDHINMKGKIPQSSVYVENQQKWASEKSYLRGQPTVMPVSCFTELQGIRQTEVRNKNLVKCDRFLSNCHAEANPFRVPYGFREQRESHGHNDRVMVEPERASEPGPESLNQPTMRLMGKNFTIGRCNNNKEHQGSDDRKVWADKKMRADLVPALRVPETIPNQWFQPEWHIQQASGSSYENLMHTIQMKKKPSTSNFYHVSGDPQSDSAHLDYRQGIISGNVCHSLSVNHGHKLDPFSHPQAPEAWVDKASLGKKICGSECESAKMRFQTPLAVCNPENVCQHLLLNASHCKHSQSISDSMPSTFPPSSAFQNSENGKYFQFPFAQSSSRNLPHWLLNAGQNRKASNSPALSFSDSISKHELRAKSGTNIFPLPTSSTSIISFPSLGQKSHVCFSDLPSSASLVHNSPFPAAKPSSTNSTYYWTMGNDRDDMKSRYSFFKSSDFVNKTRKRPAPSSNNFMKQMKRPNLCIQGDSRAHTGSKKREQLHSCTEHMSKVLDLHSYGDETVKVTDVHSYGDETVKVTDVHSYGDETVKVTDVHSYGDETVKVNDAMKVTHANAHAPITSKLDTWSRSRPLKLSAGAKHILKPSINMDQDKSMPTHSTIPFARGTASGKLPVSQKKSAKIYQF